MRLLNVSLLIALSLTPTWAHGGGGCPNVPQCSGDSVTEVLIVGAGMSGLSTAKFFNDYAEQEGGVPTDYRILEMTKRVGGRISSKKKFKDGDEFAWLEECASWVYDFVKGGNPIKRRLERYEIDFVEQDFFDLDMYEYSEVSYLFMFELSLCAVCC